MVFIGSDHGGFDLKSKIVHFFDANLIEYSDIGPNKKDLDDDYVEKVIEMVNLVRSTKDGRGILLCRNGVGVSMLANKYKGIRACLSWDAQHAVSSRNDDDTNILALPADYIDEKKALEIVSAWMLTPFSNAERHIRRVGKVNEYGQE